MLECVKLRAKSRVELRVEFRRFTDSGGGSKNGLTTKGINKDPTP